MDERDQRHKLIPDSYQPIKDGIEKTAHMVRYTEALPPNHLANYVQCFWELKTQETLPEDFSLHAVPDACVNILFNKLEPDIAGVTALRTTFEVLNLGTQFHYLGIQFFPGVWRGNKDEIFDSYVGSPYDGSLPLVDAGHRLAKGYFTTNQPVLIQLVDWLVAEKLVISNLTTAKILRNISNIHSVSDMAKVAGLSPRQLQRNLKETTNFSPHDLLKVLRLQQSFRQHYLDFYSDQSHYIHSFRKITGYTPENYIKKFDV